MVERKKDTFTEYVESRRDRGQVGINLSGYSGAPITSAGGGGERGWLGTVVDFLNIGVYPGTTTANAIMDVPQKVEEIQAKADSGDTLGALGDSFKAAGSVLSAPIRGVTTPFRRAFGAELAEGEGDTYEAVIERGYDMANGGSINYVDVDNNVNQVGKAGAGLALDIFADPLTYLSFGALGAAKLASRGAAAAKTAETLAENANRIPTPSEALARQLPEAVASPNLSAAERLSIPGTTVPKVPADTPKVTANEGADNFPANSISETIARSVDDDVLNSAPIERKVNEQISKAIDSKITKLPNGKQITLRGGLSSFFNFLKKAEPGRATSKLTGTLGSYTKLLSDDIAEFGGNVRLEQVIPNYAPQAVEGAAADIAPTVAGAFRQYEQASTATPAGRALRDAIETRVFTPLQASYNSAVQAGKNVTAFGTPRTARDAAMQASEASAAEMVATNLRRLTDGSKARGIALMGEDLFNTLSGMQANDLAPILDDLDLLLRSDGVVKDIAPLLQGDVTSKFLKLFDIDNAMYSAAKLDVAKRVDDVVDGVPKTTLDESLNAVSNSPTARQELEEALAGFGIGVGRFGYLRNEETLNEVTDIYVQTVNEMTKASKLNFLDEKMLKERGYAFWTDNGVPRTEDIFGEGKGILRNQIASYGQFNYILAGAKKIQDRFMKASWTKNLYPEQRASLKEALTLASIKTMEKTLEAKGVPITMDIKLVKDGASQFRNLRFSRVYEELSKNDRMRTLMRFALFNPGTGLPYTKLMDGVMTALSGGNKNEVLAVLRSVETRNGVRIFDPKTGKTSYQTGKTIPNFFSNNNASAKFARTTFNAGKISDEIAQAIVDNRAVFNDISEIYAKQYRARGMAEAEAVSETVGEAIMKMLNDPTKVAQTGLAIAKAGRMVGDFVEEIGDMTNLGMVLGNARVQGSLGKNFKGSAEAMVDTAEAVAKRDGNAISKAQSKGNKLDNDIVAGSNQAAKQAVEDVLAGRRTIQSQKLMDEVVGEAVDHANDGYKAITAGGYASIKAGIIRGLSPLNKFFNVNRGMNTDNLLYVSRMYGGQENIHHMFQAELFGPIGQLGKKYNGYVDESTTVLQEAWNAIRGSYQAQGVAGQAQQELLPFVGKFFNLDGNPANSLIGAAVIRGGANLDRVNQVMASKRVLETTADSVVRAPDEYFDLGKVVEKLGPNASTEDIVRELGEQWKTWDVRDPILFLDRMTRATTQLIGESGYVSKMLDESLDLVLASRTPKAGFVKFQPEEGVTLSAHINGEWYVDPEVADVFRNVSNFADDIAKPGGSALERHIDEFTDAFKYGATQARLGHHIRNLVGGLSMTGLAQGIKNFSKAFDESLRITPKASNMQLTDGIRTQPLNEIDFLAILTQRNVSLRQTVSNADASARVVHKGPKGRVTEGEIIDAIARYGIDPPVRAAEAFATLGTAQGRVGQYTQKFLQFASLGLASRGGRLEKFWTGISQGQDHFNRNHMFIQYVMQALDTGKATRSVGKNIKFDFSKPDVMEDIYTFAAERVAKYHPTIGGLTAAERRTARRLFPFYSWNKGATIALTEAIVMYPGRVSWPFKASYNLSVATGVDPNSYYDPFPTDQKFPSYMTEDINGPQFVINGKYYGFQPGLAQLDVLNQFGGSENIIDPIYTAAIESLNPGIKLPIELLTGSRMTSRNPIADISDYVDSSIPGVSYIANATTYSPSSAIVEGELQKSAKYESGDKTDISRIISAINWLTGSGVREFSRPDMARLAKILENIRLAEERENQ